MLLIKRLFIPDKSKQTDIQNQGLTNCKHVGITTVTSPVSVNSSSITNDLHQLFSQYLLTGKLHRFYARQLWGPAQFFQL